jgi:spore coat protein U-like protein
MKILVTIKSVLPAAIGVLALGLGSTSVFAATATTTFQVTADVQNNCTVSAAPMPFGNYTVFGKLEFAINGDILVVCSSGLNYAIGLNAGLGPGATVTTRAMIGPGSAALSYGLFQDASFAVNWGNTPGTDTVSRTGNGGQQHIVVFGVIPLGQFVASGTYADTITATVTF